MSSIDTSDQNTMTSITIVEIPLQEILLATKDFAEENFVASGGYGPVYQGKSEKHGMIAVKRLDRKNGQGDVEFRKEIALLSEYKHKNIVSLLGFCDENDQKILVYKLESNRSLDKHLNNEDLSWTQRLRICLDAARGLKYLHDDVGPQQRILHRDVKSANILLDERWNAKISDFGLSRIGPANIQTTLLISNACGTFGYIDPEFLYTGFLTQRSDVYSFGVVLFEVLCGRPACIKAYNDERQFLPVLVYKHYPRQTLDKIIPFYLLHQIGKASLDTFLTIAYQCLKNGIERPTMNQVVQKLQKALDDQLVYGAIANTKPKGYMLRFLTEVASPVYTGKKDGKGIEASDGNIVELVDMETYQLVIDEPLASEKVKIVLLPVDFGAVNWTPSQFKNSILTHWGNKKNLLLGDLYIDLKHGRGTIGKIWIKHDKNHYGKAKFRLGAMIDHCSYEIKEAITEPFAAKDRCNKCNNFYFFYFMKFLCWVDKQ